MDTYHGMPLKLVSKGTVPKKPVATVSPIQQSSYPDPHVSQLFVIIITN